MRSGHADGKKFGRHTTLIPAAERVVRYADRDPRVTKIVLNHIIPGIKGRHRIKITPVPAGLKIFVRGGSSGQEIHVYTKDHRAVRTELERIFHEAFGP